MTAHRPKAAIVSPERLAKFAEYHKRHSSWGAFHVTLEDGNFDFDVPYEFAAEGTAEEFEMIEFFNKLTISQRMKIAKTV